jgi:hypothetical protein
MNEYLKMSAAAVIAWTLVVLSSVNAQAQIITAAFPNPSPNPLVVSPVLGTNNVTIATVNFANAAGTLADAPFVFTMTAVRP